MQPFKTFHTLNKIVHQSHVQFVLKKNDNNVCEKPIFTSLVRHIRGNVELTASILPCNLETLHVDKLIMNTMNYKFPSSLHFIDTTLQFQFSQCIHSIHLRIQRTFDNFDIIEINDTMENENAFMIMISQGQCDFIQYDSIKQLITHTFNAPIKLPAKLERLNMRDCNAHLDFPDTLTELRLQAYNVPFVQLPNNLKILKVKDYNQTLCTLPSTLKVLHMKTFNQAIDHAWPTSLKKLKMKAWNKHIQHAFPEHTRKIYLLAFNDKYDHPWPILLRVLHLNALNQALPAQHAFPNSLRELKMDRYNHLFVQPLPSSLKRLELGDYHHALNLSLLTRLRVLKLQAFNRALFVNQAKHLKYLYLRDFNQPLVAPWPKNLRIIHLHRFNQLLMSWPEKCKQIVMIDYNRAIHVDWPKSLKSLYLVKFNDRLPTFNENLKALYLRDFNMTLLKLPDNLKYLYLDQYQFDGTNFRHLDFPQHLRSVHLLQYNKSYQTKFDEIPTSIVYFYAPNVVRHASAEPLEGAYCYQEHGWLYGTWKVSNMLNDDILKMDEIIPSFDY